MKFMIKNLFARATGNEPRDHFCALQPRGNRMAAISVYTSSVLAGISDMGTIEAAMF